MDTVLVDRRGVRELARLTAAGHEAVMYCREILLLAGEMRGAVASDSGD